MPTRAERLAAEKAAKAAAEQAAAEQSAAQEAADHQPLITGADDARVAAEQAARSQRPVVPKQPDDGRAPEALLVLVKLLKAAGTPPDEEIQVAKTNWMGATKQKFVGDGWLVDTQPHWFHEGGSELFVLSPKGTLYRWSSYEDGTTTDAEPTAVDTDVRGVIRNYLAAHPDLVWPSDAPDLKA